MFILFAHRASNKTKGQICINILNIPEYANSKPCSDQYSNCASMKSYCNDKRNAQIAAGCPLTCGTCSSNLIHN